MPGSLELLVKLVAQYSQISWSGSFVGSLDWDIPIKTMSSPGFSFSRWFLLEALGFYVTLQGNCGLQVPAPVGLTPEPSSLPLYELTQHLGKDFTFLRGKKTLKSHVQ